MQDNLQYAVPSYVGGVEAYKKHIEKRIRSSEECRVNYQNFLINPYSKFLKPVRLDVENVSRCNLACTMCQVSLWPNKSRARDMTLDEFKNTINQFPTVYEVKIQGFGEPLLGKTYFEMIEYADTLGIWTRTTINGTLLHVNNNIEKIIKSPIKEVGISIDSASKEIYESIRVGANFQQFAKNLHELGSRSSPSDIEKYKFNTVLQKTNFEERFEIIDLLGDCGFKHLNYSFAVSEFGSPEWNSINDGKDISTLINQSEIDQLTKYAKSRNIMLTFWLGTRKYKPGPGTCCPWPFSRTYISSDMRVVPCCIIGNPDTLEFIDNNNDFNEIWKSSDYNDFRDMHLNGNIPDACRYCYAS